MTEVARNRLTQSVSHENDEKCVASRHPNPAAEAAGLQAGFWTSSGIVSGVDSRLGTLFTRDVHGDFSQLWNWDEDTACFRNGSPCSVASLRPGEFVKLFAEISGARFLLSRVETVSEDRGGAQFDEARLAT